VVADPPPQTIISRPDQTETWPYRGEGAPVVFVGFQTSVTATFTVPGIDVREPSLTAKVKLSKPLKPEFGV
jgi:hypothetical protein